MNDDIQQPAPMNINQPPDLEPQAPPPQPGQEFKPEMPAGKPKKSKKKLLIALLLVLFIAGSAAAAYFLYFKKDSEQPQSTPTTQNQQEQKVTGPNTLVYALNPSSNKYTINWNLVDSTEKNTSSGTFTGEYTSLHDVSSSNVAFTSGDGLFLSTDAGKSFTKIKSFSGSKSISSLKFSNSGTKLAYNLYDTGNNVTNPSVVVSIEPKNPTKETELFKLAKQPSGAFPAAYIQAWDDGNINKMIYSEGCTQCDGPQTALYIRDLSKNTSTKLLPNLDVSSLENISTNQDFSTVIYTQLTIDKKIAAESLPGYYIGTPISVNTLNLSTNKTTQLASVGVKGQKDSDGTYKYERVLAGFMANSNTPYYTFQKDLYSVTSAEPKVVFTASSNIQSVQYVDKNVLIGSTGENDVNFNAFNYNFATKKFTSLLQSKDSNTMLLGVTTND